MSSLLYIRDPVSFLSMAQPSNQEQYLLELANRFRLDPQSEYDRLVNSGDADVAYALEFFDVDFETLRSQWGSLQSAQPLAWSDQLHNAAAVHNQLMIDNDTQSHNLPGEAGLGERVNSAGPNRYNRIAESIFAFSESPFYAHAGFAIDWGDDNNNPDDGYGTGIQNPAGHRNALLNNAYREAGFSILAETDPSTDVGPNVVTQLFGNQNAISNSWLVGVAFDDIDNDTFYSIGEGLDNITVNISGNSFNTSVQTGSAGGYQTLLPSGSYTVSFAQNGNTLQTFNNITLGSENVKQDFVFEETTSLARPLIEGRPATIHVEQATGIVAGNAFQAGQAYSGQLFSNTDADFGTGASASDLIMGTSDADNIWAGLEGNDIINSGSGDDIVGMSFGNVTVDAGEGDDFVYGLNGGSGNNIVNLGAGNDNFWARAGNNVVRGLGSNVIGLGRGSDRVNISGGGDNVIYMAESGARDGRKDILTGSGKDYIQTGSGDDLIDGGGGLNTLLGGAGADTFTYRNGAYNFIADFERGSDRIKLDGLSFGQLDFYQGTGSSATDAFIFVGNTSIGQVANIAAAALDGSANFV